MVEVGTDVDRRRLFNDWVLTHELIHTGMPFIRGRGTWFMEGAATYVEPIIRARAGWKTEEEVWREWVDNMPQGVEAFSRGLANASGRQNYWAGATFMLLADIAIRRASNGAKGLDDCLAGVLWSGLDGGQRASVADYAAACDRATGTTAMSTLVDRHFNKAEPVDLAALWKELGISLVGGRIVLDDSGAVGAMAQDDRAGQPSAQAREAAVESVEHPVVVRRLLRDRLHDVPVLDDLAVLQPEDVDDGHAALAGLAHAMDVQDHVVALGEGALDLALGAGELLLAQGDEGL